MLYTEKRYFHLICKNVKAVIKCINNIRSWYVVSNAEFGLHMISLQNSAGKAVTRRQAFYIIFFCKKPDRYNVLKRMTYMILRTGVVFF